MKTTYKFYALGGLSYKIKSVNWIKTKTAYKKQQEGLKIPRCSRVHY